MTGFQSSLDQHQHQQPLVSPLHPAMPQFSLTPLNIAEVCQSSLDFFSIITQTLCSGQLWPIRGQRWITRLRVSHFWCRDHVIDKNYPMDSILLHWRSHIHIIELHPQRSPLWCPFRGRTSSLDLILAGLSPEKSVERVSKFPMNNQVRGRNNPLQRSKDNLLNMY